MDIIDKKLSFTTDITDTLIDVYRDLSKNLYNAALKTLQKFDSTGGYFKEGQDALEVLTEIRLQLNRVMQDTHFKRSVDSWFKNFSEIDKYNALIQKDINNIVIPLEKLSKIRQANIITVRDKLIGSGVDAAFSTPLTEALIKNVVAGASIAQTTTFLRNYIVGTDKLQGKLIQYSGQIATDAIMQYDGTVNQIIMQQFDMDGYQYVGSLIADSRPQCVRWINDLKGFISNEDLPKEIEWAYKNGSGMIGARKNEPKTTVDNFAINRGGWRCRHTAVPTFAKP